MEYVFLGKTLHSDRVSARLLFANDRLQIRQYCSRGSLDGTLRGNVSISLARKTIPRYRAAAYHKRDQFPRLTDLSQLQLRARAWHVVVLGNNCTDDARQRKS